MTPQVWAWSRNLLEPAWPWPKPHHAACSGVGMPSSRAPGLLAHVCEPGDGPCAPLPTYDLEVPAYDAKVKGSPITVLPGPVPALPPRAPRRPWPLAPAGLASSSAPTRCSSQSCSRPLAVKKNGLLLAPGFDLVVNWGQLVQ